MTASILTVEDFSYGVDGKTILSNVQFSVTEGEYLSIVGANGAGKSTLLKALNRILTGGTGRITIAGKPLEQYRQKDLAKIISYVPQADNSLLPFTVYPFVLMGRYPHLSPFTLPDSADHDAVNDALEMTHMQDFKERPISTLSGGEKQKVLIAAALAQEACILLLDEPTTYLDPRHADDILKLMASANRQRGVTILQVTHDINSAVLSSHRILGLKMGKVIYWDESSNLMVGETLENIYGKSFLQVPHPADGQMMILPEKP